MIDSNNSIITSRNRDCLTCRIVSGCGLIGAGFYISQQSKKFEKKPGKSIMISVASVLLLLGTARIMNLPPFRNVFNHG